MLWEVRKMKYRVLIEYDNETGSLLISTAPSLELEEYRDFLKKVVKVLEKKEKPDDSFPIVLKVPKEAT